MIRDWLYNHPIWEVGTTVVVLSVLVSWLGLYVFARLVPVSLRSRHNDVAGFIIAIIGVIYAVLLAFIAVAAWASFDNANTIVQQEANLVGNLYRDSIAVPQPARHEMRHHLRRYLEHVVEKEWPAQQAGKILPNGWLALQRLHRSIIGIDAKTLGDQVIEEEMLRTLNTLYSARRTRLLAAADGIPDTIWTILILGGVITVGFTFFFGMPSMAMHYTMTGLLAGSMALVMVLIVSLDWPFRGEVSISSAAYEAVQQTMHRAGEAARQTPVAEPAVR